MKKGIVLGIVLVLLALPYFVLGLEGENSRNEVKVTPVEHIISPTTEQVIHHYQDLTNMPIISQEDTNKIGSGCSTASDCGTEKKVGDVTCIGSYNYQIVAEPRCMIRQNASTPPVCSYDRKDVVVGGC